ncbi:polysaccharide biosynthesis protein, partial [Flavobacterium sp.]|uniref:polysaccharide biosynthesis protein n=1 Tax=Flavobacterium sp. TaxID=239 RepID=UPI0032639474
MKKNFLIIGGGEAGKLLLKSIFEEEIDCNIIGVVDDNEKIGSKLINDVSVLGTIEDLPQIIHKYNVERIIIAIPSERGGLIRKILLQLQENADIEIYLLPRVSEIVFTGQVSYTDIRPMELVDLVGEMIVKKDQEKLKREFKGKNILVTGGGGSIGSELSKQIFLLEPKKLIIIEFSERNVFYITHQISKLKNLSPDTEIEIILANVNNTPLLKRIFDENKIDIVFHAAAYKHVPILEDNPYEAIYNNAFSTFQLAGLAGKYKIEKFVLISTDKAVQPVNVMGRTKKLAEKIVSYFDNKYESTVYTAVRFGNVFNSSGSAIELFLEQIEKDNKIT